MDHMCLQNNKYSFPAKPEDTNGNYSVEHIIFVVTLCSFKPLALVEKLTSFPQELL